MIIGCGLQKKSGKRAFLIGMLFFLLFFSACGDSRTLELKPEGELSVHLPGIMEEGASKPRYVIREKGKEFFFYFDPTSSSIRSVPLEGQAKVFDSIPLDAVPKIGQAKYYTPEFCYFSPDSLFLILNEKRKLYLLNRQGKLLDRWRLERPDGKPHRLYATSKGPFESCGQNIYIRSVPRISSFGETRKNYYTTAPELSLSFQDTALGLALSGGWPEKYQDRNYYNSYPHRELIQQNGGSHMLYSFKASHSLYLFDGREMVEKVPAKSRYFDEFEVFDEDSLGNIAYTKRFLTTSPGYAAIAWDPFRKLYYRQAMHPCSYEDPGGETVKTPGDQPWSLIVMDEDFEKLQELKMDPDHHLSGSMFVSRKGLLIRRKQERKGERMQFTVFKPRREK